MSQIPWNKGTCHVVASLRGTVLSQVTSSGAFLVAHRSALVKVTAHLKVSQVFEGSVEDKKALLKSVTTCTNEGRKCPFCYIELGINAQTNEKVKGD